MKLFTLFCTLILNQILYSSSVEIKMRVRFDDNFKEKLKKRYATLTLAKKDQKKILGTFLKAKDIKETPYLKKHLVGQSKFFLLEIDQKSFLKIIFNTIAKKYGEDSLCFTDIIDLKAHTKNNNLCHGHPVFFTNDSNELKLAYINNKVYLQTRLKNFNFGTILEGMITRSGRLGDKGLQTLISEFESIDQQTPKTIASIHVMGFGKIGGNYNILEMQECKKRNIVFMHSYHSSKNRTVYMDGTDPDNIDFTSKHHGNIYEPETIDTYVADEYRELLKIEQSIRSHRRVTGDIIDFLQTIENIIDAPWPVHIHCKGGKHKTGMLGILFRFLAYKQAMDERYSRWFSVSDLTRGIVFKRRSLRPAEIEYAEYNGNVYRHENIEFMRRITSGEIFKNRPLLQQKWDIINEKFRNKVRLHAFSTKFNLQIE